MGRRGKGGEGLRVRVVDVGFRVYGIGFTVYGLGFRA